MHTQVDEAALVEVVRHVKAMGYNPYIDPLSVWIEPKRSTASANDVYGELNPVLFGNWEFILLSDMRVAVIITPEHLKAADRDRESELLKRLLIRLEDIATPAVH